MANITQSTQDRDTFKNLLVILVESIISIEVTNDKSFNKEGES